MTLFRNVGNLLRDNQINLAVHAVIKEPAPLWCRFHVWWGRAVVNIEFHKLPLGTQGNGIGELFDVVFKIVLVTGLIEIPDIDPDLVRMRGVRAFPADVLKPAFVISNLPSLL